MIKDRPETPTTLPLDKIRIDGGTQMRADLNEDVVADYAQIVRDGGDFPPVVVFYDGSKHWLADGFHRYFAYQRAGAVEIPAEIRKGSKRDAILFSVGANAAHGLRRTNADKRRSVETLLKDKEWAAWSDREVARIAKVSAPLVATVREALSVNSYRCDPNTSTHLGNSPDSRTVERNGAIYQQNTANIGKGRPATLIAEVEGMIAGSRLDTDNYRARLATLTPNDQVQAARRDLAMDRKVEKDGKAAQQAENDRWREEHSAAVPEHIRQAEAIRDAAIAKRRETTGGGDDGGSLSDQDRIAELREHIKVVEAENATLKAENVKYEAMRVQFEQGGFEKVVAGKDEELRVAREQFALENADKVTWMGKAKHWRKEAERLGWKPDIVKIDTQTGALKHA